MKIVNNKLYLGNLPAESVAKKFGTPSYVYDESVFKKHYENLVKNISYKPLRIYYAVKANSNIEILKLFRRMGAGAETVSRGEILAAMKAGFKPQDIVYTCSNITRAELEWVVKKGIMVNIDSLTQLEWFGKMKPGGSISIRINHGIGAGHHDHVITGGPGSKFGIYHTQYKEIVKIVQMYKLKVVGLHQHIGSNILDEKTFILAMESIFDFAQKFKNLEFLDFGGGFGVPYQGEKPLNMVKLGPRIAKLFQRFCKKYARKLELRFEPGRYLVAQAGYLLAQVVDMKKTPGHKFVGVNTGLNHLIRPAMYDSYHEIVNASNLNGKKEKVSVCGYICESGDVLAKNRKISKAKIGDLFVFLNAGAYGYVMSSNYNLRPRPPEILISGKTAKLIRKSQKEEDFIYN